METYEKILVLNNEFEAGLLEEVLTDRNIPHGIVTSDDTALGGIVELEYGWGYVEAPPEYREEILGIFAEITKQ
ncbi:MAG TPA: hypothetical protein PKG48_12850 [Bacteroidales bacterium]|nr:hypothetical protein [Bacteroidales bacterium]HPS63650.1 hypothetical protein [Bacteroidales bacterium]